MTAARTPHTSVAAAVGDAHDGRLAAQKLVHELRTGTCDADLVLWNLYRNQVSPDRLRAFVRELQRVIEQGGDHE